MPTPTPCVPCCSTPQTVNVPGIAGDPGADGANGINAYSLLTAGFTSDGSSTWTLQVDTSAWMAIGQIIVIDGPVHLKVVSKPSTTSVIATEQGYPGDVTAAIGVGAVVSPSAPLQIAMQKGTGTLTAGTVTISQDYLTNPVVLTANSLILATWSDPDAATVGVLSIPIATRNVGAGTFVVNSVKADGTTPLTTDTGSFDWLVIG